jgi:hypothetical protein
LGDGVTIVVKVSHAKCRQCGQTRHRNAKFNLCGQCWRLRKPQVQEQWRAIKDRRAERRTNGAVHVEEVVVLAAAREEVHVVAPRPKVSLSPEQRQEIIDLYMNSDTPVKEIASTYGVPETAPFRILSEAGITWRRGDRMPESRPGPKRVLPPHIAAMQEVHVAPTPAPEPKPAPEPTLLDVAVRNGPLPTLPNIADVDQPVWRVEFSGALDLVAPSFDEAVKMARELGALDITLVRKVR